MVDKELTKSNRTFIEFCPFLTGNLLSHPTRSASVLY